MLLTFDNVASLIVYLRGMYFGQVFNLSSVELHLLAEPGANSVPLQYMNASVQDVCIESTQSRQNTMEDDEVTSGSSQILRDHTYHACVGNKPKGKKQKTRKKDKHADSTDSPFKHASYEYTSEAEVSPSLLTTSDLQHMDVAAYCSIVTTEIPSGTYTSNDMTFCLPESTNPQFETYIRLSPNEYCSCCDRFLFSNQVKSLGTKTNAVIQSLHLDASDKLCSMCYKYLAEGKIPSLSSDLNSLKVDNVPEDLSCLNSLEKKLVAKIQVCMTLIILPGGQYAEKGLIVDLPQDVESLVGKLVGVNSVCTVHFEHQNAVGSRGSFLIDAFKVIRGFMWLKSKNILYRNLSVNDLNFSISNSFNSTLLPTDIQKSVRELEHVTFAPVDYTSTCNLSSSAPQNDETSSDSSNHGPNQSIWIPRNKATPVSVYEITSGEEQAFPWLFPEGKHGFTYPRPKGIQLSLYFRYRLYNHHPITCSNFI